MAFLFRLQSPEETLKIYHVSLYLNNGYCVYNYATSKSEVYISFHNKMTAQTHYGSRGHFVVEA